MKSYQRFFLFLLLVLLATSLLSPWVAALWERILDRVPEWREYRYPFSRIFDRLFMITGISCFFLWRARLKIGSLADLGLDGIRARYPDAIGGFLLAVGSIIALALLMALADIFSPYLRLSFATGVERSVKALLAALTVGVLEEIFFRGILLKGMLADLRPASALAATNLFYSAIHFVQPSKKFALSGFDPVAGFRHVVYAFEPFLDPLGLLPGLFGLFLIGLVLSYAFMRTGSLYLAIGLHAGWVFGLKTLRVYGDFRREDLGWLFGATDPKLVSGVASWVALLIVAYTVHLMTRTREGLRPGHSSRRS
ncbi:MAG: CPBP family intramembrane metalloprotease [Deltaproteobacteria bacterium]|nr:CPBP family intramembrane metalloprotease [Deltaproteobacteria bacterium]